MRRSRGGFSKETLAIIPRPRGGPAGGNMITALIFFVTILSTLVVYFGVNQVIKLKGKELWWVVVPGLLSYAVLLVWQPENLWFSNIGVLTAAVLAGSLIGRQLGNSTSLIVFSITAALVDIFSFSGGLTKKIIDSYEQGQNLLLRFLTISIPLKGKIVPLVGLGDLLIMGAIFYVLLKLKYPGWQCLLVPLAGLLLAVVVGLITGGVFGLPFIAAAVIAFLVYKTHKAGGARSQ